MVACLRLHGNVHHPVISAEGGVPGIFRVAEAALLEVHSVLAEWDDCVHGYWVYRVLDGAVDDMLASIAKLVCLHPRKMGKRLTCVSGPLDQMPVLGSRPSPAVQSRPGLTSALTFSVTLPGSASV